MSKRKVFAAESGGFDGSSRSDLHRCSRNGIGRSDQCAKTNPWSRKALDMAILEEERKNKQILGLIDCELFPGDESDFTPRNIVRDLSSTRPFAPDKDETSAKAKIPSNGYGIDDCLLFPGDDGYDESPPELRADSKLVNFLDRISDSKAPLGDRSSILACEWFWEALEEEEYSERTSKPVLVQFPSLDAPLSSTLQRSVRDAKLNSEQFRLPDLQRGGTYTIPTNPLPKLNSEVPEIPRLVPPLAPLLQQPMPAYRQDSITGSTISACTRSLWSEFGESPHPKNFGWQKTVQHSNLQSMYSQTWMQQPFSAVNDVEMSDERTELEEVDMSDSMEISMNNEWNRNEVEPIEIGTETSHMSETSNGPSNFSAEDTGRQRFVVTKSRDVDTWRDIYAQKKPSDFAKRIDLNKKNTPEEVKSRIKRRVLRTGETKMAESSKS